MTETPIVRRSRCGCVHDHEGHCLMVCSVHTEAVEGRVGVRLRTLNGELAFFALAPEEARPAPPEGSLCGEEENLVTLNDVAAEYFPDEDGNAILPPGPADPQTPAWGDGLEAWVAHCKTVGPSRLKAYDEAFSLVQAQFVAWREVFPSVAREAAEQHGAPAPGPGEVLAVMNFAGGFAGFLTMLRHTTQTVRRR